MLKTLRNLIPQNFFLRAWFHRLEGFLAALVYGFPARKLKCVGITGTDGKTTTTILTAHLLSQKYKVGMASSVYFQIGDERWKNKTHKTTLGRFGLQKLLRQMVKAGCEYAVLEASSIALHQGRLTGVPFQVAAITNLAKEHLAYHGTMENLKKDKGRLFQKLKKNGTAVLNKDDEYFEYFETRSSNLETRNILYYTLENKRGSLFADNIEESLGGTSFEIFCGEQSLKVQTKLLGHFNVYNALAATAIALSQGLSFFEIKAGLESFEGVPGRMERVDTGQDFHFFIDFALTPQAFKALHFSLKKLCKGKLIAIFGACGGGRDTWRRKVNGKLAAELCDLTILTDDEPYNDNPEEIIADIKEGLHEAGAKEGEDFVIIRDRREAIEHAVKNAEAGDVITLTGLGDFEVRMMNEGEIPWSDRHEARQAVALRMPNVK